MTARTISTDMPDFPDTVRLTQEAPGMVGDTIEGTHAGVRHTRRRYAATLAALIAASAMVAGCTTSTAGPGVTTTATSGSSTATTTPTATATSTPSATTAPTAAYPADVPAEARANTPAGAIAFAKHFFGLVNRAYTTPQAGLLTPLSTANCKTCAAFESTAADFVAQSQRYDRAAVSILEVAIDSDPPPAGMTLVDVVVDQLPAKVIDSKGSTVTAITGRRGVFVVQLQFAPAGWAVDTIQVMG
jgi:hypothetical protein